MEVRLSEEAAAIVARQVADGWYADEHEAVEAAVAMLASTEDVELAEWIRAHRAEIDEGLAAAERGELIEVDEHYFDRRRAQLERKASAAE